MQKNQFQNTIKIISVFLILSLVFFCLFSCISNSREVYSDSFSPLISNTVSPKSTLKNPKNSILCDALAARIRTFAEMEEEKLGSQNYANGLNGAVSYLAGQFYAFLIFFLSQLAICYVIRGQMLFRYSIIHYLHLSDGKKPASLLS